MAWIVGFFVVGLLFFFVALMVRGAAAPATPSFDALPIEALKLEGVCRALHQRGLAAGRYDEEDLKSAQRGPRSMVAAWELMEWADPGTLERGRSGALADALGLFNCANAICGCFLRHGFGKEPVLDQLDLASDVSFAHFLGRRDDLRAPWIMTFVEQLASDRNEFAAVIDRAVLAMSLPPTSEEVATVGGLVRERLAVVQIRLSAFQQNEVTKPGSELSS
jgi:hypothetical protein